MPPCQKPQAALPNRPAGRRIGPAELKKIYFPAALIEPTAGSRKQNGRTLIACASAVLRLQPACPIEIGSARNKGRKAAMAATFAIVSDAAGCLSAHPGSRRNFIALAAFSGYFISLYKVSLRGRRWGLFHPPRLKRAIMKRLLYWVAGIATVTFAVMSGSGDVSAAERRVALVVGNATYNAANMSLSNPRNDAEDISAVLKELDFRVVTAINATRRDMELKLQEFARLAVDADAALFFYAGHAMQFQGRNFLMPTDAQLEDEFSVRFQMVALEEVNAALERVNGVRILILDACRNNPLADRLQKTIVGASRSVATTRGLARVDKTQGMVVAYATAANDVANDGQGRNSPFTAALLKRLREPGLEIELMFRRVASDVDAETGHRQHPEHTVSLLSEYYLNQSDRIVWERINQDDIAALRDFVNKFPSSPLGIQARNRLDLLERYAREREEMARRAREEEQRRLAEEADAKRREELKRQEEQKRIAAQDEQKRLEEQKRIAALPADAPATKVQPALATPPGPTTQPQVTKANLPEQIRQAQTELKRLGCLDGNLDGKMNTTEKAIKAFWQRSHKPGVEINITDDFIGDLQRQPDDFCVPPGKKPPAVATRPSSPHTKGTAAASPPPATAPREARQPPPAQQPARATAEARQQQPAQQPAAPRATGIGF